MKELEQEITIARNDLPLNVNQRCHNFMIINELRQHLDCYVYINKTTSVTMTSQVLCCNMTLQHFNCSKAEILHMTNLRQPQLSHTILRLKRGSVLNMTQVLDVMAISRSNNVVYL